MIEMPADHETTAALTAFAERLEAKMDKAQDRGEEQARRIYEKMDAHHARNNETMTQLGHEVTKVTTRLEEHMAADDRRFAVASEDIRAGTRDRRSIWQWIVAAATAGGLGGSALGKLLGGGGSP